MDEKWMKNGFSNGPCIANLPIEIVIVRCVKLPCLLCFSRWDHDQKTIETKIEKQKAELKKKRKNYKHNTIKTNNQKKHTPH